MAEQRKTYTFEVENLAAAEADTIVRLLHATGYPVVIVESRVVARDAETRHV
jgi:hypothetical protein